MVIFYKKKERLAKKALREPKRLIARDPRCDTWHNPDQSLRMNRPGGQT